MRQLTLSNFAKSKLIFGGSLIKSGTHPKGARPLASDRPIHLVLRAERSAMRLPKYYGRVNALVTRLARKHHVRVYAFANCGNHLHHVIKLPKRAAWNGFIRDLTGRLAELTGVRWLNRPFTRIIDGWRKAFRVAKEYVRLNQFEVDAGLNRADARELVKLAWADAGP